MFSVNESERERERECGKRGKKSERGTHKTIKNKNPSNPAMVAWRQESMWSDNRFLSVSLYRSPLEDNFVPAIDIIQIQLYGPYLLQTCVISMSNLAHVLRDRGEAL